MARILVTRPQAEAEETADRLRALGHEPILAPLLEIQQLEPEPLDLSGVQALICTSVNGVRALVARTSRRDLPLFVVGPRTAVVAHEVGFTDIRQGTSNARSLAAHIARTLKRDAGRLVHVAGADVGEDPAETLGSFRFQLTTVIGYRAVTAERLPEKARTALAQGRVDAVLLFSPRTARTFVTLVAEAGLLTSLSAVTNLSLSLEVAEAARQAMPQAEFRQTLVAAAPNSDALLALLVLVQS